MYTEFSSTNEFFIEVVATSGCKIWNSNLIGYLVSIYLASFRWKELRKENKKKFLSVERCFWPVGTDFTLNLICFSQKSTDNLEITILCLQSYLLFLLSRLKCRYISFTLYFAHQNSSFIQIVNTQRIKTHFNLGKYWKVLSKVSAKYQQSTSKVSAKY